MGVLCAASALAAEQPSWSGELVGCGGGCEAVTV